jgi:DNA-directed RNA polymerase subunit F
MALIRCKECLAAIAENARSCPACGFTSARPEKKKWFELFITASGPLIISAAGTLLAYLTFVHKAETKEAEKLQTIIESAVSGDSVKERTAVRLVSYLAKLNKLPSSFALSILGTIARSDDEMLRSEVYDAIENLTEKSSVFDKYDQLEIYCLRAALTPVQYWRQVNLHKIEQYSTDRVVKYQAGLKLLSLARDASNPQAIVDILLSVPLRLNDPDLIERAIPILCKALRDRSINRSNSDVADFLQTVAAELIATDRDKLRSQIRIHVARALVTRDQVAQESSLKELARILTLNPGLEEDIAQLFEGVIKSIDDPDLREIAHTVRQYLILEKEKTPGLTQAAVNSEQ